MDFSDIRAYPERLFKNYWAKITDDPQFSALLERLAKRRQRMGQRIVELSDWHQFRNAMVRLVGLLIRRTSRGVSVSGGSELTKHRGAIFISNHRSTSLDPMLFNYVHHRHTGETVFNAAGDNLMNTPWLGHLIRLNRGFVVKRNVEDLDEKLEEAEKLSHYIRSLVEQGRNVWIAQRNGRAKDGDDRTDSAVLAMLKMAHREKSWQEFCAAVPLIPVSMSYEEIPLDTRLAMDSIGVDTSGDIHRDRAQVISEISQKKRRIHIHISSRVQAETRSRIVAQLDNNIICGTRLWRSNNYAARMLERVNHIGQASAGGVQWLKKRLLSQEEQVRLALLRLYAAPAINRCRIES